MMIEISDVRKRFWGIENFISIVVVIFSSHDFFIVNHHKILSQTISRLFICLFVFVQHSHHTFLTFYNSKGDLLISSVTANNAGLYQCVADNNIGRPGVAELAVTVSCEL